MAKVRTCPECGSKFTPIKSQVCCCTRCKEARRRRRSHDYYVQHRITKPKPKPELTPKAMRLAAHAALRTRDAAYFDIAEKRITAASPESPTTTQQELPL